MERTVGWEFAVSRGSLTLGCRARGGAASYQLYYLSPRYPSIVLDANNGDRVLFSRHSEASSRLQELMKDEKTSLSALLRDACLWESFISLASRSDCTFPPLSRTHSVSKGLTG